MLVLILPDDDDDGAEVAAGADFFELEDFPPATRKGEKYSWSGQELR